MRFQIVSSRHNIEPSKVRCQYRTLIDCVDIEDTNVFNRVVDSCALERIIFIPSEQEAQNLLKNTATVGTFKLLLSSLL